MVGVDLRCCSCDSFATASASVSEWKKYWGYIRIIYIGVIGSLIVFQAVWAFHAAIEQVCLRCIQCTWLIDFAIYLNGWHLLLQACPFYIDLISSIWLSLCGIFGLMQEVCIILHRKSTICLSSSLQSNPYCLFCSRLLYHNVRTSTKIKL